MRTSTRPRLNGVINRVALVGIELEGGWDVPPPGEDIVRDGSVKFPGMPDPRQAPAPAPPPRARAARAGGMTVSEILNAQVAAAAQAPPPSRSIPNYKGEVVSRPIPVEAIETWVRHAYPQHVNETCGLHVHMSFTHRLNYSRLMTPDFTPYMVQKVREFAEAERLPQGHPQWDRINRADHPHCAHIYCGEAQSRQTRKDYEGRGKPHSRYTFVNYPAAMHPPGTVEVRGLAMMETPDQAVRAILMVVTATNQFLSKLKQRERAERVTVAPPPETEMSFGSYVRAA